MTYKHNSDRMVGPRLIKELAHIQFSTDRDYWVKLWARDPFTAITYMEDAIQASGWRLYAKYMELDIDEMTDDQQVKYEDRRCLINNLISEVAGRLGIEREANRLNDEQYEAAKPWSFVDISHNA